MNPVGDKIGTSRLSSGIHDSTDYVEYIMWQSLIF